MKFKKIVLFVIIIAAVNAILDNSLSNFLHVLLWWIQFELQVKMLVLANKY